MSKFPFMLFLIGIVMIIFLNQNSAYSESTDTWSENKPNEVDWSIFFVTTTDKCYANHHNALSFYKSLTQQYLKQFNLPQDLNYYACITDDIMPKVIQDSTQNTDLTIVIPDYLMSVKQRHTAGTLGHYGNWNAHIIVSQAETWSPENKDTGWILSHELSHFVLDWKKYPHNIMEESVHEIQDQYNTCKKEDTTLAWCSSIWTTVKTPSGKWFPVMSPHAVLEIADAMKPKPTSQPKQEYSNTPRLDYASQYYYKIQDKVYALEELCNGELFTEFQSKTAQDYLRNQINRIPKACVDASSLYSKMTKGWTLVHSGSVEQGISMLSDVHDEVYNVNIHNIKSILNDIKKEAREIQNQAHAQKSSESKLTFDNNSFIIKEMKTAKLKMNPISPNMPIMVYAIPEGFYSVQDDPIFTLYKKTQQSWDKITTAKIKYSGNWIEGNFGNSNNFSEGNYKIVYNYPNSETKTLQQGTITFEIINKSENNIVTEKQPNTNTQSSFRLADNDQDSDGIPDKDDLCDRHGETYNGFQDTDGCPDSLDSTDTKLNNNNDTYDDIFNERIRSLWSQIDFLNLKLQEYNTILDRTFESQEANDFLNKAQKQYDRINQQVKDAETGTSDMEKNKQFTINNPRHNDSVFDNLESKISSAENNLKYIDQELQYAKNAELKYLQEKQQSQQVKSMTKQEGFCFLLWCW